MLAKISMSKTASALTIPETVNMLNAARSFALIVNIGRCNDTPPYEKESKLVLSITSPTV
jgi:hypothetical protein